MVLCPEDGCDNHFNPHSPRREWPAHSSLHSLRVWISIHTLLAESDTGYINYGVLAAISIHTLLAESDQPSEHSNKHTGISIHTLLAESDKSLLPFGSLWYLFQSTLSSQRVTVPPRLIYASLNISIHTLLAESVSVIKEPYCPVYNFNPHSPRREWRTLTVNGKTMVAFQSTLSSQRVTVAGESSKPALPISIHTLLAESDEWTVV